MVFQLDERIGFPDPKLGEDDGLLAIGGDLKRDRLLLAYSWGIFPWYDFKEGEIQWWCPKQRFVIFPEEIHVSHSMKQLLRKQEYSVTIDYCFDRVIHACAQVNGRNEKEGAWLGEDMIAAYTDLHSVRVAHSVEVWRGYPEEGNLVGGLYGVLVNKCFIGESMFSFVPSASKIALIALARFMAKDGGRMIDCQLETPHLRSMGGRFIPYEEYLEILHEGLKFETE